MTSRITELTFFAGDHDEECVYAVEVTWRGDEKYAVKRRSQVWNGSEWEYEPLPSSRDDAFIERTRFDFDTACDHARTLVERSLL